MTTLRQIKANRRNAKRSTGPKTATGKSTSCRNAISHGLSIPVSRNPRLSQEILDLATRLANGERDLAVQRLAMEIAECHVEIRRVREIRRDLLRQVSISKWAESADLEALREL